MSIQQPPLFITVGLRLTKVIFLIGLLFFLILSFYFSRSFDERIFNSPDETANYFFLSQFKKETNFFLAAPSGDDLPSIVHPRSMLREGSRLIPVGFIGFPFFGGVLAKIFGLKFIPYLILFITALAVFAWVNFLKIIFGKQLGYFSGLLLILHPAFFYYALRPFSPNILFISFLIFAAYFFVRTLSLDTIKLPEEQKSVEVEIPFTAQSHPKRRFFSFLFGLSLSTALILRPVEAPWIFLGLILILIFLRKNLKSFSFLFSFLGFVFVLTPFFYFQKLTYGGFLASGYNLAPIGGEEGLALKALFFPFGFDLSSVLKTSAGYLIQIFWWLSLPLVLGLIMLGFKWEEKPISFRRKISFWIAAFGLVVLWLLLYYGPWELYDRLDEKISIGVSYVRYFLPIYILSLPLIAFGLLRFGRLFAKLRSFTAVFIIMLVFLSLRTVWWHGDESVSSMSQVLKANEEIRQNLLQIVSEKDLIVTERGDKIFFPHREIISYFRQPQELQVIKELSKSRNIWYETIMEEEAILREVEALWKPYGLKAIDGKPLGHGHMIYKLVSFK